jgi:hypothetical protein
VVHCGIYQRLFGMWRSMGLFNRCFSFVYVDDCGLLNVIYVESCAIHSLYCLHV